MEECLEIHNLVFHGNQHFEVEHRPIEHSCKKENKIETTALGNMRLNRIEYVLGILD